MMQQKFNNQNIEKIPKILIENKCDLLGDENDYNYLKFDENGLLVSIIEGNSTIRRQDLPTYYKVNGAIYINKVDDLNKDTSLNDNEIGYIMDKTHSTDIDEYKDIAEVNYYLGLLGRK